MKVLLALAAAYACLLAASLPAGGQEVVIDTSSGPFKMYDASYALLIGNSQYDNWADLTSVPSDIENLKEELLDQGFTVETASNLDTDGFLRTIRRFLTAKYPRDTRLLIYYGGHGWSEPDGEIGYLVPVNATERDDDEFRATLVSMDDIKAAMERPRDAKHVLFIFDSCFAGTIFTTRAVKEASPAILNDIDQPGRQFITSGSAGEEVPAASIFAPALLQGITGSADLTGDGLVTGTELGLWLHDQLAPSNLQTPQWGSMPIPYNKGDFVFLAKAQIVPVPVATNMGPNKPVLPNAELREVNSDQVVVRSGGPNAICALQATQICAEPQFGGRLLADTASFVIDGYSAPVILEGGTEDRSSVSNVGWWMPPNPVPDQRVCVRVYARTSACESEVNIMGHLNVFEEIVVNPDPDGEGRSTIVYFEHEGDVGRVESALNLRKLPFERRKGSPGLITNVITCTPDASIEIVKEVASELIDMGIPLRTIHIARLDPMPTNRISIESNPEVEDWPVLTKSRIEAITECPPYGHLEPKLISITNQCPTEGIVDASVRVLDAADGVWKVIGLPAIGYNKTKVLRNQGEVGDLVQTDFETIYVRAEARDPASNAVKWTWPESDVPAVKSFDVGLGVTRPFAPAQEFEVVLRCPELV